MSSELLVISKGKSFMVDALISNLKNTDIHCTQVEPKVKEIERQKGHADMILFFADEMAANMLETVVFLKDICADDEKVLFVVGYAEEIAEVEKTVPKDMIAGEFERPFDVKELIGELRSAAAEHEEKLSRKNILLVDDDVTFLKMMRNWLAGKYQVTAVKSGMQAITYIAGHTPDLILLDYDMPITPGSKIMEMIKSEPNSENIPIIFLTGKSDRESVMSVMSLKPQGYLLKSMPQTDIVAAVDNFFQTKKWQNAVKETNPH